MRWLRELKFDAVTPLLTVGDVALEYFVRRDLLEDSVKPIKTLWQLPRVTRLLRQQERDGSWRYPSKKQSAHWQRVYAQLQTYKTLSELVSKYGLTKKHPAIRKAAGFLLSFQTPHGDLRGLYGNQYSPNYTAGILEILIYAGYTSDPRVVRGMNWLVSVRQNEGGWAIPLRTRKGGNTLGIIRNLNAKVIEPDRTKPFSHLVTGIVLRAFAAHPRFRKGAVAKRAGALLASRFFKPDVYADHRPAEHWMKFQYPFFWTDLISSLDSLSKIGFTDKNKHVALALRWLREHQQKSGLWKSRFGVTRKDSLMNHWVSFVALRSIKQFKNNSK